jgi:hypothetical protein
MDRLEIARLDDALRSNFERAMRLLHREGCHRVAEEIGAQNCGVRFRIDGQFMRDQALPGSAAG